jgi:hypothetical protein
MQGRAPNILDYLQMRRTARNTPVQEARDIEGEMRLKIQLAQSIADLEKTKAEIKKGVITGMTDMATKFASAQASMMSALAAEVDAQAKTTAAKADIMELNNKVFANARGAIAAATPEEDFMKQVADPASGIASTQTSMTSALSNPSTETAQLIQDLSTSSTQVGFDGLVNMLDEQYVTGPNGMVPKLSSMIRTGSNQQALVPNAYGAMAQIDKGIAAALQSSNLPEAMAQQVYTELRLRAASQLQGDVVKAANNPGIFTDFAQSQSQAKDEMRADTEAQIKKLGVGINAKTKKDLLGNLDTITGMLTAVDPFAQTQVAKDRLTAKGYTEPVPLTQENAADPNVKAAWDLQKKSYDDALRQEVATTIPLEGFAQRLATLPVAPEIDEQIKYLKGLMGNVGKTRPDQLIAATYALRKSMGDDQFNAWSRLTGANTDEEAAIEAAKDPTKLAVFRRVAGTEAAILTNPEQYRGLVRREAADEASAAKQAAKASAKSYGEEGEAVQEAPSEEAPRDDRTGERVAVRTPEERAEREASLPAFPPAKPADIAPAVAIPGKFDVSQWSGGIESAMNDEMTPEQQQALREAASRGQGPMGMAAPGQQFQSALTASTAGKAQLFGPQGFMAQQARRAMG